MHCLLAADTGGPLFKRDYGSSVSEIPAEDQMPVTSVFWGDKSISATPPMSANPAYSVNL